MSLFVDLAVVLGSALVALLIGPIYALGVAIVTPLACFMFARVHGGALKLTYGEGEAHPWATYGAAALLLGLTWPATIVAVTLRVAVGDRSAARPLDGGEGDSL